MKITKIASALLLSVTLSSIEATTISAPRLIRSDIEFTINEQETTTVYGDLEPNKVDAHGDLTVAQFHAGTTAVFFNGPRHFEMTLGVIDVLPLGAESGPAVPLMPTASILAPLRDYTELENFQSVFGPNPPPRLVHPWKKVGENVYALDASGFNLGERMTLVIGTGNERSFRVMQVSLKAGSMPVPEPSSTALLGLGGLALILRRRR